MCHIVTEDRTDGKRFDYVLFCESGGEIAHGVRTDYLICYAGNKHIADMLELPTWQRWGQTQEVKPV